MEFPDYSLEEQAKSLGYKYIVGTDEAGRGCGVADVVAAAVYIPEKALPELIGQVNDSKKLTPKRRESLFEVIMSLCSVGVQKIGPEVIDDINILEATKLAMRSAIEQLEYYDYVLVDGTVDLSKHFWCPTQQVIKGDTKSISIAAASIVAKVTRDRIMLELHDKFPLYNWKKNKGYLTKEHIEAIKLYGPTNFHRLTFSKVKDFL